MIELIINVDRIFYDEVNWKRSTVVGGFRDLWQC